MKVDSYFQVAILISLLFHGVILLQNSDLNLFPHNKIEKKIEVSYLKEPEKPIEHSKSPLLPKKDPFLELNSKITQKKLPPPFITKQNLTTFSKPAFTKPDIIAIKKKITLPPIDIDKINNPSYISYYQIVREKIKRAAYQNYTRTETGEVYLTFIISHDGYLKETRLIEEKSSLSPYLRAIALRSLKDASPFPNFPKELDYPQLSFNVVISFEIE